MDNKHGFSLVSRQYIDTYKAYGTLYRHDKSGMEVFYIDADNEELFFSYAFATLPSDSSGVFHIIEHTVLSGSRKYPVRDPFTTLSRSSASTYMNALTCPDMTLYPASSPVRKDFDNIFSVYTDAVFHPLLRKETFLQEGVRLTKNGFDGVVFNEMRGDGGQQDSVVATHALRDLFRSGPYSFESGGEVTEIAGLTYERYLETYRRFYAPANARLFLFGRNAGLEEKLAMLDSEYLDSEGGSRTLLPEYQEKWASPEYRKVPFPALEGENTGSFTLSFLTDSLTSDPYSMLFISILVDILLGSPSCPLYRAITDSGLGEDLSSQSGMSSDFGQIPFTIGFSGISMDKCEEAGIFLMDTLRSIATAGLDPDGIEAAIRRQEFLLSEIPGGIPLGFRAFFKCIRPWMREGDIYAPYRQKELLERLRSELSADSRLFEKWMLHELCDNPHRLYLSVYPDPEYSEREEAKLKRIAAERGYDEKDEELFDYFTSHGDSDEILATIPRLRLCDIPDTVDIIPQEFHGNIILQRQLTGGVIYSDLMIDLSDLSNEELCYASLLTRLLLITGLKGERREEIHTRLRLLTGGYSAFLESGRAVDNTVKAFFVFRLKLMPYNLEEMYKALRQLMTSADVTDRDVINAALNDISSDFAENCEYSGSSFAASAAAASVTPSAALGEAVMGLESWAFFESLRDKDISSQLAAVYARLSESGRFMLHLTCEAEDGDKALSAGRSFISSFAPSPAVTPLVRRTGESGRLFEISSSVAYNAIAFRVSPFRSAEQEAENIFSLLLSQGELFRTIRGEGGAYGAYSSIDAVEEVMTLSSYRDPHLGRTFKAFISAIENAWVSEAEIENAKLLNISRLLKPLAPASKAMLSFRRYIYKVTDEDRMEKRRMSMAVTEADVNAARDRILAYLGSAGKASLAPYSLELKEESGLRKTQLPRH